MILLLFCRELIDRLGRFLDIPSQRSVTIQLIPDSCTKTGKIIIRTPCTVIDIDQADIHIVQEYLETLRGSASWDNSHELRSTIDWRQLSSDLFNIINSNN